MNINSAFPSKYLKAGDLNDADVQCRIRSVRLEQIGQNGNEPPKPVIYFDEFEKGLICNKTNAGIITKMYGEDTSHWIGQLIVLWPNHDVQFKDEIVSAIRVRSRAPASVPTPARQSEPVAMSRDIPSVFVDPAAKELPVNPPKELLKDPLKEPRPDVENRINGPQTLDFALEVQALDAQEHVNTLLRDFGYADIGKVPIGEQRTFIAYVKNTIKRAQANAA